MPLAVTDVLTPHQRFGTHIHGDFPLVIGPRVPVGLVLRYSYNEVSPITFTRIQSLCQTVTLGSVCNIGILFYSRMRTPAFCPLLRSR